jgi:hypothetical protein
VTRKRKRPSKPKPDGEIIEPKDVFAMNRKQRRQYLAQLREQLGKKAQK